MTLGELKKKVIEFGPEYDEYLVTVAASHLNEKTVGPSFAAEVVVDIGSGFDWDSGKILLFTEHKLVRDLRC